MPSVSEAHGHRNHPREPLAAARGPTSTLPPLNQLNLPPLQSLTARYTNIRHDGGVGAAPGAAESSDSDGAPAEDDSGKGPDSQSPKRKAQNRVAQRALRKRRAARVSELEAELERQKEVHQEGDAKLTDQISELELEVASYQSKCRLLEEMLEQERTERLRAEIEVQAFKRPKSRDKDASPTS